jgi:hypothetical protein
MGGGGGAPNPCPLQGRPEPPHPSNTPYSPKQHPILAQATPHLHPNDTPSSRAHARYSQSRGRNAVVRGGGGGCDFKPQTTKVAAHTHGGRGPTWRGPAAPADAFQRLGRLGPPRLQGGDGSSAPPTTAPTDSVCEVGAGTGGWNHGKSRGPGPRWVWVWVRVGGRTGCNKTCGPGPQHLGRLRARGPTAKVAEGGAAGCGTFCLRNGVWAGGGARAAQR